MPGSPLLDDRQHTLLKKVASVGGVHVWVGVEYGNDLTPRDAVEYHGRLSTVGEWVTAILAAHYPEAPRG